MQQQNQVGGMGNGPNAADRSSQVINQELAQLKQALDAEIYKLPPARAGQVAPANSRQAINDKLTQAIKDQHKFSHGNLIKQLEDQQKKLKEELIAEANIQDQNNKTLFNNALTNYLNKRTELARAKLQEVQQADKHTKKAQKYVTSHFRTPDGKTGAEVIQKLADNTHSHILPVSGKEKEIVKYENGILSSRSPVHLAYTAKSMGKDPFKFVKGKATLGGARNLINSVEEMFRVGMKGVSIDKELLKRMLAAPHQERGHSSGDYAAQLAKFIISPNRGLNVSGLQKRKLRQLNRFCKASTAAYNSIRANPVYDADGQLKTGNEPTTLAHQAETFMRLTSISDRVAYLKMLYPVNTQRHYAAFTKELERRGKTFFVDGQILSPSDYFKQKLLWRFSRSKYQAQVDLSNDFAQFNGYNFLLKTGLPDNNPDKAVSGNIYLADDGTYVVRDPNGIVHQGSFLTPNLVAPIPDLANRLDDEAFKRTVLATTSARGHTLNGACVSVEDRKKLFSETSDDKLIRRFAKSQFIDNNQKREDFVTAVFDKANERQADGHHAVKATADSKKLFINRTLPLISRISVNSVYNQLDIAATLSKKSALLNTLRDKAESTYTAEKAAQNPAAFSNFHKNKALLDELEDKMLQDHQQTALQDLMQRVQRQPTDAEKQTVQQDTMRQHYKTYFALPEDTEQNRKQKAEHFIKRLSPPVQQQVWAGMEATQPNTLELRAQILKEFMDLHNETDSEEATTYLKNAVKPLIARLDDQQKAALMTRVAELCQNSPNTPINGCQPRQNRALHALRDLVPTPAAKPLLSTELFKTYFHHVNNNGGGLGNNNNALNTPAEQAEKLLKRIKCYAIEKPANWMAAWRHNQKFDAEMSALLFPGNNQNPQINAILTELRQGAAAIQGREGEAIKAFVKRIEPLQPNYGQVAKQNPVNRGVDDGIEMDSLDDTAHSQSSAIDEGEDNRQTLVV